MSNAFGQGIINLTGGGVKVVKNEVSYYIDSFNRYHPQDLINSYLFKPSNENIINFYKTQPGTFWFHFKVANLFEHDSLLLDVHYPLLDKITLYKFKRGALVDSSISGLSFPSSAKKYPYQNPIFNLNLPKKDTADYLLKVQTVYPIFLPLQVNSYSTLVKNYSLEDVLSAMYAGIIFALFLYNIFIYFTVRDSSYIYYVIYILFIGLTQITLFGYSLRFIWPSHPEFNRYAIILFPAIAGISYNGFARTFMNTREYTPRLHKLFDIFNLGYIIAVLLTFFGKFYFSYRLIDFNVSALAFFGLFVSVFIAKQGSRSAIFFLIAGIILIFCAILYAFRDFGLIPFNIFTSYLLYIGSAIQAILLSIALADRINVYRKEKEESQLYALKVARENEVLIKEQNIVLEQKVAIRTEELQQTNKQLSKTLGDLQDAQIQLVEAEKMASLGQLTAGIAHEINNPINFVKSNIKPLRLDINDIFEIVEDYNQLHNLKNGDIEKHLDEVYEKGQSLDVEFIKTEIQQLLKGIEEGAERTAEIVRGLKTFSRLDEAELKTANIHDGLESTLVLLRNSMPKYIKIEKKFCANGEIDCLPGKLNQVFMNILNNGMQAIAEKEQINEEEFITITTRDTKDNHIQISIKDTGKGMTEQVKHRIFEPFFTTKAVGEGTGLGMAIVFKIIEEHHGKIDIISEPGKGAEFIITLPRLHSIS